MELDCLASEKLSRSDRVALVLSLIKIHLLASCIRFSGPLLPGYRGFPLEGSTFTSLKKHLVHIQYMNAFVSWTRFQTLDLFRKVVLSFCLQINSFFNSLTMKNCFWMCLREKKPVRKSEGRFKNNCSARNKNIFFSVCGFLFNSKLGICIATTQCEDVLYRLILMKIFFYFFMSFALLALLALRLVLDSRLTHSFLTFHFLITIHTRLTVALVN